VLATDRTSRPSPVTPWNVSFLHLFPFRKVKLN
jgi:hypothetical protein